MAAVHLRLGKISEAKDNLMKLFEFNQNVPEAHNNLGLIYLNEKNTSAAISSFETAIALKPNFLSAYESLAKAYVLSGDGDKAQVIIRKYLQLSGK